MSTEQVLRARDVTTHSRDDTPCFCYAYASGDAYRDTDALALAHFYAYQPGSDTRRPCCSVQLQ